MGIGIKKDGLSAVLIRHLDIDKVFRMRQIIKITKAGMAVLFPRGLVSGQDHQP